MIEYHQYNGSRTINDWNLWGDMQSVPLDKGYGGGECASDDGEGGSDDDGGGGEDGGGDI